MLRLSEYAYLLVHYAYFAFIPNPVLFILLAFFILCIVYILLVLFAHKMNLYDYELTRQKLQKTAVRLTLAASCLSVLCLIWSSTVADSMPAFMAALLGVVVFPILLCVSICLKKKAQ